MKRLKLSCAFALLAACSVALQGRADSIINNFATPQDYVANGIIGDTNWDGVYLGFGDIPGGNAGGSGSGATQVGNTTFASGFLSVTTIGSDWSANGDDGFYLWKLVSGDFDVSVQSASPWQALDSNFGGLLVRAWNTNLSGAPINFTGTNASENWLALFRFQQFSLNEIREANNGTNVENTFPEGNTDTNSTRYLRITRTGDTFSFYIKTNASDSWSLITNASTGGYYIPASGSISRPDWHNQPVQVGIAQAVFSRGTPLPLDYFTDFELSGPSVKATPGNLPAAPDTLVTSAPNPNGSLTLSWNTNGGTGSIVILRKIANPSGVLNVNPVQGLTYAADTNFLDTNTLISGNAHVVFAGIGTNVTVSGLAGSNNLYMAEVLSYDSTGSILYNTANPATTQLLGSGVPASVAVNVFPTNMPLGGVGQVQVIATFTTGDKVDVTSDPNTVITSDNPSTVNATGGVLSALQLGSANISATYAGFSGGTNVTVTTARFSDDFSVPHDYLNQGLPGSAWDGLYDRAGDIANGNNGGDTMLASNIDADITSNNVLSVSAEGTTLEGASDDAFFLYKIMPGDFQAIVHVDLSSHGAYQFAGLVARAQNPTNASAPYIGGEHNMAWWFFDQFSTPFSLRRTQNGNATEVNLSGTTPVNTAWILLERLNGTNFLGYYKFNLTDPWTFGASQVDASLSNGVPLQVGLAQSTFTANPFETVRFDSFSLDGAGLVASPPVAVPPPDTNFVMTLNPDVTMTLSWIAPIATDGTAPAVARSIVIMRQGAPVSAQPNLGFGFAGNNTFGDPANSLGGGNYVVFRTAFGDTNQNQQVTVTGLKPGQVYYAAVYTFSGLGATRTFNTSGTGFGTLQDGTLIGLQSKVAPLNGVPLGGVGLPEVDGVFSGGGLADISPAVTITSDNTNILVVTNNVLTGLTLGSSTIHVSYSGFTNVVNVTVRNPIGYTDDFATSRDYLANGVSGSIWDGLYVGTNVPDKVFASDPAMVTTTVDANITSNNVLSIANLNSGYEFGQDDGTFLFKYVPGDFQASVDLINYTNNGTQPYNCSGLLARGYTLATNGTLGAPLDQAGNECWIAWERFDEFGIGTRYEATVDNATQRPTNPDINGPDRYMLLARLNGTNFYFFQRTDTNSPWHATGIGHLTGLNAVARFAGQPMQVGLMVSGFDSGTAVNAGFANFVLDVSPPGLSIAPALPNVMVTWPGSPSAQLQYSPRLNPANWQPVPDVPVFTNGQFNLMLPTTNNVYFRVKD